MQNLQRDWKRQQFLQTILSPWRWNPSVLECCNFLSSMKGETFRKVKCILHEIDSDFQRKTSVHYVEHSMTAAFLFYTNHLSNPPTFPANDIRVVPWSKILAPPPIPPRFP